MIGLFTVSSTTTTVCAVAVGTSSTGLTATVMLPTAMVSSPTSPLVETTTPLVVNVFSALITPPLSFTDTVNVALPVAFGAGTKLNAPLASTVGRPTNRFVPSL